MTARRRIADPRRAPAESTPPSLPGVLVAAHASIAVPRRTIRARALDGRLERDRALRDAGGRRRRHRRVGAMQPMHESRQIGAAPVTPETSRIGAPEKLPTHTPTV